MTDSHGKRRFDRRSVLKVIGTGIAGTAAAGRASETVSATTDGSTHYHNELYGPHFPDPTIHRDDSGTWWAYGTNMDRSDGSNDSEELLIPILRSDNLHEWTYVGEAFDSRPGWTYGSIWAPDIHYYDGEWVMFYSLSPRPWESGEFGIGLAKSDTPDGPFTDYGQILGDNDHEGGGSIDGYFVEHDGTPYLFWGSFQGIYVTELTADLQDWKPSTLQQVAGQAYEGTCVFRRNGYWYLFVATGTCCDGYSSTYEVEVGRSQSLFGPYTDPSGTDMLNYDANNAGVAQLTANSRFAAPGHGDIATDDNGRDWFVYHAYDRNDQEYVDDVPARQFFLDRVEWTEDDWPLIAGDKTPSLQSVEPNANDTGVLDDGIYRIANENSGKLLEVADAGTADGDNVRQWSNSGCACQRWWVEYVGGGEYRIVNQNSNRALDVTDGSTANGASLQQWGWWTGPSQKWEIVENGDGTYRLRNVNSGKVADVLNASTEDGADVVQYDWTGDANQRWSFDFVKTVQPADDGRPW
ncbi:family 43 glycosylhydrolase [Halopelagius longus]|uniref:Arabinan endo-1,5-alpha-L-arabinosidase n=1 Tax=Halopelagius longus TaxID=1236180 RepID=A0A1H1FNT8_9EURY|nr:family 43 glycosylhydrolase [Halopelagius longus]RDI70013.1 glycoside hydrolase family 43 [Halopelagius longus]SDR02428.1 arabinan endo-1,5-alpha-L-arabinosidase [Halopelagius longus]